VPIRAITFDFWRTLFRENQDVERRALRTAAFCKITDADRNAVDAALIHAEKRFLQHHIEHQITLRPEDAVRMVSEEVGVQLSFDDAKNIRDVFATAILEFPPVPIDGALDAVKAAAERFPIGVISDAGLSPGSVLTVLLERNGFRDHFKSLVFSSDVGVAKPQAKMFHTAAAGIGCEVADLLHIGDLEFTDIIGAHAVGAKAALFAGDNTRYFNGTKADFAFRSWSEFIEHVPSLQ
jgi:FMN phosphatase YigB (HAD superfamily)